MRSIGRGFAVFSVSGFSAQVLGMCALLLLAVHAGAQTDPLPSWNDGPAKKAIVTFVQAATTEGSPTFVPPAERVATFDQDGTLWVSHPHIRWYADNIWLFVPVQQKLKDFLLTLPEFPFQDGSSLNAANINYTTLKAVAALKRLKELESLTPPNN